MNLLVKFISKLEFLLPTKIPVNNQFVGKIRQ